MFWQTVDKVIGIAGVLVIALGVLNVFGLSLMAGWAALKYAFARVTGWGWAQLDRGLARVVADEAARRWEGRTPVQRDELLGDPEALRGEFEQAILVYLQTYYLYGGVGEPEDVPCPTPSATT